MPLATVAYYLTLLVVYIGRCHCQATRCTPGYSLLLREAVGALTVQRTRNGFYEPDVGVHDWLSYYGFHEHTLRLTSLHTPPPAIYL